MIDESTWLLGSIIPYEILKKWREEHEKGPELLLEVVSEIGDRIKKNPIAYYLVSHDLDDTYKKWL